MEEDSDRATATATATATPSRQVSVLAVDGNGVRHRDDRVAVEEPLEIRVASAADGRQHPIAVTMRTPGHDRELAAGFLLSEAIVTGTDDLDSVREAPPDASGRPTNRVTATLRAGLAFDPEALRRNVYTGSSCGICGRATLERVATVCPGRPAGESRLGPARLLALPETLRAAQTVFADTGGLHAAALFDPAGTLRDLREDVGRHNAVDKLVGALLLADALPAADSLLMVSGRASYELVQKALMAGIPTLAAVGAPSSLAVSLARAWDLTLIGFLRDGRFNLYTAPQRVATARAGSAAQARR